MRVKCTNTPSVDRFRDTQITSGKFYTVNDVKKNQDGIIFYTVVGDDGIEVDRPSFFFTKLLRKK